MEWIFSRKAPAESERNPTSEEYFNKRNSRTRAAMLVREAFQNSLDARVDPNEPVRLRFHCSENAGALTGHQLADLMSPLFLEHLRGGLGESMPPDRDLARCPYLLIEDFNTTGLEGDERAWEADGEENSFYYFLRAEGATQKAGGARGSWGIGKTIFPAVSRIHTYLAFSCRKRQPAAVFMGRCTLKYHKLLSATPEEGKWRPDGWFGVKERSNPDFALPDSDPGNSSIIRSFDLKRKNERGLSVIVPFVDVREINFKDILDAVVEECSFAIADGSLVAEVSGPMDSLIIDRPMLNTLAKERSLPSQARKNAVLALAISRQAEWESLSFTSLTHDRYQAPGRTAIGWTPLAWFRDGDLAKMKERWEEHGRLRVTVYLHFFKRPDLSSGYQRHEGHFEVYLFKDDDAADSPLLLREGLLIPGMGSGDRPIKAPGCRAVVNIPQDSEFQNMVRDSEDPSHQGLTTTEKFRNRYRYGKAYLDFLRASAKEILRLVQGEDDEDADLLGDILSVPLPAAKKRRPKRKQVKKKGEPGPNTKPATKIELLKDPSGFRLTMADGSPSPPSFVDIKLAYSCDAGDPFKQFDPFDFDLKSRDIKIVRQDSDTEILTPNSLRITPCSKGFRIEVTGFDTNRDLVVRSRATSERIEEETGE